MQTLFVHVVNGRKCQYTPTNQANKRTDKPSAHHHARKLIIGMY
ncbi:Uncharacterised protein [Vibrio cholerae]|nr:Uncharacterised protein [Vibrio cholerae]